MCMMKLPYKINWASPLMNPPPPAALAISAVAHTKWGPDPRKNPGGIIKGGITKLDSQLLYFYYPTAILFKQSMAVRMRMRIGLPPGRWEWCTRARARAHAFRRYLRKFVVKKYKFLANIIKSTRNVQNYTVYNFSVAPKTPHKIWLTKTFFVLVPPKFHSTNKA